MVIPQAEEAICPLGQIIERNVGKREFYVVHPDGTPWYERNSGTSKLERCRCQMAQSLVCQSEALGSYPEGIWCL